MPKVQVTLSLIWEFICQWITVTLSNQYPIQCMKPDTSRFQKRPVSPTCSYETKWNWWIELITQFKKNYPLMRGTSRVLYSSEELKVSHGLGLQNHLCLWFPSDNTLPICICREYHLPLITNYSVYSKFSTFDNTNTIWENCIQLLFCL